MCGIFGWIPSVKSGGHAPAEVARRLISSMRHRGPNDNGFFCFGADGQAYHSTGAETPDRCALLIGQTRLSIIDLSSAGHQPMSTPDGRYTIVFNGEVYNYVELREELKCDGEQFLTHSDTEVLLRWVVRYGKEGLGRLTGMFAFALFDRQERTLFCARDFFGIKPFYYSLSKGGFCFASELPALLEFPAVERRVCAQTAYTYLMYGDYDIGGRTFLQDVHHLPPGHCLTLRIEDAASAEPVRYWKPDLSKRSTDSFPDAAQKVREMFLDNVRLHLRSDVPLGVALSGGIDSSAVTCAVRHLEPDAELHTFSFVARNSEVSEEEWIDHVSTHARVIQHKVFLEPADLVRDLDAIIRDLGEPFGSTSIYAQRRVFQLARESGVVVTLEGQGADELFGGYSGYPGQRLATMLSQGNLSGAYRFLRATGSWPGRSPKEALLRLCRELAPDSLVEFGMRLCGRNPVPAWLDGEELRAAGVRFGNIRERDRMFSCPERLRKTLAYQLTWHGLPQLLRHGDRNSMSFSIEGRVPFLTREMAEYALSLPEEYLVDGSGCTKKVFRAAMRGLVPDAILDRRDKVGFATPEQQWLQSISSWVDKTLQEATEAPLLRLNEVRAQWQLIRDGARPFDFQVWRWINYLRWVALFDIRP